MTGFEPRISGVGSDHFTNCVTSTALNKSNFWEKKLAFTVFPLLSWCSANQCDQKKLPNVYKSCPKMISLEKWKTLTPLQILPKNVGDLDKLIVVKGFKSCPKSNKLPNLVTLSAIKTWPYSEWKFPLSLSGNRDSRVSLSMASNANEPPLA